MGGNNYLPFQEINKTIKKLFQDIKGISGWLEMCKDMVSV